MKRLSLRTQLVVAGLLLAFLAAGVSVSWRVRRVNDAALQRAYEEDLLVLSELPRLRGRLRQLDFAADKYLLTGDENWLPTRDVALKGVRSDLADLDKTLIDPHEKRVLSQLREQFESYLSRQKRFMLRRQAGALTAAEAEAFTTSKRSIEDIVDLVMTMKDVSVEELQESRRRAEVSARATFILVLTSGFGAAAAITLALSLLVVRPVLDLERRVREWQFGEPWPELKGPAGPEIVELDRRMGELAARLNEQYQLRSQVVSLASHEFNNALSVLSNVAYLLEETEKDRGKPNRSHYYVMLNSNLKALTAVVNNLLNLGRLESGRFALSPRRVEIRTVLEEAVERLELLAQRKKQKIVVQIPNELAAAEADPEALSLVATNLLTNAIKYTPESGRITVTVVEREGGLRVAFADTGIGIAPEDQKKIMEGYYRAPEGKAAAKGFGLGLSLTRQIIEAHDSKLEVVSSPGNGSTFFFDLRTWKA